MTFKLADMNELDRDLVLQVKAKKQRRQSLVLSRPSGSRAPTFYTPGSATGATQGQFRRGMMRLGLPTASPRRSIVKLRVVSAKGDVKKQLAAHAKYIERDAACEKTFDSERDELTPEEYQQKWQSMLKDPRTFRFVISPEDGERVDFVEHTREFMDELQDRLTESWRYLAEKEGLDPEQVDPAQLNWVAAIHSNTDHRHVHILMGGLDENGREIFLPKPMVAQLHKISSEILTERYGHRLESELIQSREKVLEAERVTDIDRQFWRAQEKHGYVAIEAPEVTINDLVADRDQGTWSERFKAQTARQFIRRLGWLEEKGLAERIEHEPGELARFRLSEDFLPALKQYQLLHDIQKRMHRSFLEPDPHAHLEVVGRQQEWRGAGKVLSVGYDDELQQRKFLIFETAHGTNAYATVPEGYVKDVNPGDLVGLIQEKDDQDRIKQKLRTYRDIGHLLKRDPDLVPTPPDLHRTRFQQEIFQHQQEKQLQKEAKSREKSGLEWG